MELGHGESLSVAPGELVAIDVPPGPAWVPLVHRLWHEGIAFMPLDERLPDPERRRLLDLARPAAVLGAGGGSTVYAGSAPVDPDLALVMATSGTGGVPRLVELSRDAVTAAVGGSRTALEATGREADRGLVACLTPAHIGGMLVLLRGELEELPVVVHERFDVPRLAAQAHGSSVSLVPTMLARLVRERVDLASFGTMLVGGASLPPHLRGEAEALGASIVESYGSTESCGGVVYDGLPFPDTDLRIGDGSDRSPGGIGGIELRGPTVMRGYRADPAANGAAFDVRGWLRTGDAGSIDEHGRLRVSGRLDEAIRTGAETVWPVEVERALESHPKVDEVAVGGRPHPEWGQQVVAFVVPRSIADAPSLEELRDHVSERIARHKAPREVVLVHELPRTAGGKLRRRALATM